MTDYIDWPGKSGRIYRYWFLTNPTSEGIKGEAGNYMFVKRVQTGWVPAYIGQADNLKTRIPAHERWLDAKAQGATHVMAHTVSTGERVRLDEERDLIARWDPPCNTHHTPSQARSFGR